MKPELIILPLLLVSLTSCDKAKNLADKASSAVKECLNKSTTGTDDTTIDPALKKLVKQTAEGAIFRKDLPFPTHLEVRMTRDDEISGRIFQTSAIEHKADIVKGNRTLVSKLERDGGHVRYTCEKSGFFIPSPDEKEGLKKAVEDPLRHITKPTQPVVFRLTDKTWKCDTNGDFRSASLSSQLAPVFENLLEENALSPRPMWFSKRRLKVGDEVVVSGESMPMLFSGETQGSLKLKLESFQAVEGHPCGVFSLTGNYNRKQVPDFDGGLTDEEVTVQSGKIWLSLIYPVILKEELLMIQTFKSGGHGGLEERGQGTVKHSLVRSWKILPPP